MKGFLFDANVPSRLQFKPTLPLISLSAVNQKPTDTEIWNYAAAHRWSLSRRTPIFPIASLSELLRPGLFTYALAICESENFIGSLRACGRKSKGSSKHTHW